MPQILLLNRNWSVRNNYSLASNQKIWLFHQMHIFVIWQISSSCAKATRIYTTQKQNIYSIWPTTHRIRIDVLICHMLLIIFVVALLARSKIWNKNLVKMFDTSLNSFSMLLFFSNAAKNDFLVTVIDIQLWMRWQNKLIVQKYIS